MCAVSKSPSLSGANALWNFDWAQTETGFYRAAVIDNGGGGVGIAAAAADGDGGRGEMRKPYGNTEFGLGSGTP
ncbi:unnamed protein product [Echinostoma caproni]|uniref:Cellulase n=1 Tax=Echinostoma caproni TaxID=27848 RepID=A0A183A5S3_9TREM|nr:unnamed protein product [Echinostoma caproni]